MTGCWRHCMDSSGCNWRIEEGPRDETSCNPRSKVGRCFHSRSAWHYELWWGARGKKACRFVPIGSDKAPREAMRHLRYHCIEPLLYPESHQLQFNPPCQMIIIQSRWDHNNSELQCLHTQAERTKKQKREEKTASRGGSDKDPEPEDGAII